jgi:hypothetical protein
VNRAGDEVPFKNPRSADAVAGGAKGGHWIEGLGWRHGRSLSPFDFPLFLVWCAIEPGEVAGAGATNTGMNCLDLQFRLAQSSGLAAPSGNQRSKPHNTHLSLVIPSRSSSSQYSDEVGATSVVASRRRSS